MNKIVLINGSCGVGSTGKICISIAEEYEKKGWEAKIAYGRVNYVPKEFKKYSVQIGNKIDNYIHGILTRIFDWHGYGSVRATKKFLKWLTDYQPDILWLHNIHGYYINIEMLFEWIKKRESLKVKWTLHDCWAFTGHCAHFSAVRCEKWKRECEQCCQKKLYPASYFWDNSRENYQRKKKAFCGVKNMELITPSKWLARLVKQSFLRTYNVQVIHNPINHEIFRPIKSDFKQRIEIENRILLLGVSYIWDKRKGLNDFIELSKIIDDRFKLLLIGLNDKQIKSLPQNIMGMKRTTNQMELAEIYSAADFFINPSVEETFGMTTVEALSCGAKAIVYSDTACEEIANEYGGIVVKKGSVKGIYEAVMNEIARKEQ